MAAPFPGADIAPTAVVDPGARLGRGVSIGHGTIVGRNVELGDESTVGPFCILGHEGPPATGGARRGPLRIGKGATIRSHTVLYEGSTMGDGLETGHGAVVREGTVAGTNLRVGGQCLVMGDCTLGDYVRLHSNVQVGKGSRIGDFVWLFPGVCLTNDPLPPSKVLKPCTIEDGAVVATSAILMPGTVLGAGAYVSPMARASGQVPSGAVVAGLDGQVVGQVRRLFDLEHGLRHPWMNHFRDAYPAEARPRIDALRQRLEAAWRSDAK